MTSHHIYSPTSIHNVLDILVQTCQGSTKAEVERLYSTVNVPFSIDGDVEVHNYVIVGRGHQRPLKKSFLKQMRLCDVHVAKITLSEDGYKTVNRLIEIKSGVQSFFRRAEILHKRLLIGSVVVLKTSFSPPFLLEHTRMRCFTNANGCVAKVPMMRMGTRSHILHDDPVEDYRTLAISIGSSCFLVLILRRAGATSHTGVVVDRNVVERALKPTFVGSVYVTMPRFEACTRDDIKSRLIERGVCEVFSKAAKTGDILDEGGAFKVASQAVDEIIGETHASFRESMEKSGCSFDPERGATVEFKCDRPFAYAYVSTNNEKPIIYAYGECAHL